MPRICLKTTITAPIDIVFDLSRSIDLHTVSTKQTNEEAIAGKTSGLIGLGESVTWRAKHLGFTQSLTSKVTDYNHPSFFADEMAEGIFKRFRHEHHFETEGNQTLMTDIFEYQSPFGILGKLADFIFLENYLRSFLKKRNTAIKEVAESDEWKKILK
ncbi:SRPBCC family protein [Flavobacterium microcysteis]|uniref:SRPBCC family protein n=1 Tax=Flavobacterium microcysteis TaxID=2596891 RepID=A0A501PZJ3_9FLAO|nr:SRPBCC family protein [Flavobacterium microcysteis]TPD65472.1 SRPBCC family protein [Flavobacterium microcysteis]